MKKPPLSRRDFLKLSWASLWGFVLAACGIETDEETPAPTPTATKTSTPEPETEKNSAPAVEEEPTPTNTPTETPLPCFKLLTPEDEATLDIIGKVIFSWEAMPSAEKYEIEFILPTSQTVKFEATETSHTRYLESLFFGGEFFWKVTALNSKDETVCISSQFSFTKPAAPPSPVPKKDDGGDSSSSGTTATSNSSSFSGGS